MFDLFIKIDCIKGRKMDHVPGLLKVIQMNQMFAVFTGYYKRTLKLVIYCF